jgi:hypothetical protein
MTRTRLSESSFDISHFDFDLCPRMLFSHLIIFFCATLFIVFISGLDFELDSVASLRLSEVSLNQPQVDISSIIDPDALGRLKVALGARSDCQALGTIS